MNTLYKLVLNSVVIFTVLSQLIACGGGSPASVSQDNNNDNGQNTGNTTRYSVSGNVYVDRDSGVDLDVEAPYDNLSEQNNDKTNAQLISNPITLGGYISGKTGSYSSSGIYLTDLDDYFRVSLVEGQNAGLSVFFADADQSKQNQIEVSLSLALVGQPDNILTSMTIDSAGSQSLNVPTSGEYYIHVQAEENLSDPILYTLSLSQTLSDTTLTTNQTIISRALKSNFIAGEVIVKFKNTQAEDDLATSLTASSYVRANSKADSSKLKRFELVKGLRHKHSIGKQSQLFSIESTVSNKSLSFEQSSLPKTKQTANLSDAMKAKWETLQLIESLKNDADVVFAEPNYIRTATFIPSDPEYYKQWSLPMISLPAAWEVSTGESVSVAVIDTGIDQNHIDLVNNISPDSYDFISDSLTAGDEDGIDSNPQDLGKSFHGSHVAGIVAAEANNNEGITGIAYDASIMALRVLGVEDTGSDSDIANAILYAAGLTNDSGTFPSKTADIINLSLGGPDYSQTLEDAVNAATAQGVIVIAAAGNNGTSALFYPAAYEDVVAVSSVNDDKTRSNFSNFGDFIDVAAPGGTGGDDVLFDGFQDGILSTVFASEYVEYHGTSMAAPHVAGVAALMKSSLPELNSASFLNALESGELTDNIGQSNFFGYGLINAAKSVTWANSGTPLPTLLNIYPSQLSFIGSNTERTLSLTNSGAGTIAISSVTSNDSWLDVNSNTGAVDQNGLGDYSISIDSAAIPANSSASSSIDINYRINSASLQTQNIKVFVSNTQSGDDTVGGLHIYLINAEDIESSDVEGDPTQDIVYSTNGQLQDGIYAFNITKVLPGSYYLKASTDNDGDFLVFDVGEARGAYPLFSQRELIVVERDNLTDLNFDVGYQSFVDSSLLITE